MATARVNKLLKRFHSMLKESLRQTDKPTPGSEDCIEVCKENHRKRIWKCDVEYEFHHDTKKHRECLADAKRKYDLCIARCRRK